MLYNVRRLMLLSGLSCLMLPVFSQYKRNDFKDVLDLRNSLEMRHVNQTSAMLFSDMGAWHGYALPAKTSEYGGFNGPVLFNEIGLVLSPSFAKLSLKLNGTDFNFKSPVLEYYPGMIRQEYSDGGVIVEQKLIFTDARSALIKVSLSNHSMSIKKAEIGISGTINPELGTLHVNGKNIEVRLNKAVFVSALLTDADVISTGDLMKYSSVFVKPVEIAPSATFTFYIRQSGFTDEREMNNPLFRSVEKPEVDFSHNQVRWNRYLNRLFSFKTEWTNEVAYRRLAVKSAVTLLTNWRSAAGDIKHDGIFPSYNFFDGFWAWDSWKHAAACALFDTKLAENSIRSMFDYQDKAGMVADCIFLDASRNNYRNTKPPLAAWAVWEVYRISHRLDFIKEMYPSLKAYHKWWYNNRDHDGNGLCEFGSTDGTKVAAAWESGMDNAVRFDHAEMIQNNESAWSVNQESVDLNSFLYDEKLLLSKMAALLGLKNEQKQFDLEAGVLRDKVNAMMFDKTTGFYGDIWLKDKKSIGLLGPEGFIPLWTGLARKDYAALAKKNILDSSRFNTYLPFPTFQADHPDFDPKAYWRGPVWLDQVMFGTEGLKRFGYKKDAAELFKKLTLHAEGMLGDGSLRETYNPLTGTGMTVPNFSWSAASLLRLLLLD